MIHDESINFEPNSRDRDLVLTLIIEEASEIIKEATKILRFGPDSRHPFIPDSLTNKENLVLEIGDLLTVVDILIKETDAGINWDEIEIAALNKLRKLQAPNSFLPRIK